MSCRIFCFVKSAKFCPPRCLSFADNWLRLQRCVVVVNANPVSGNDTKLEDDVGSFLLKISTQFQIKNIRISRHFQDLTQELDTHLSELLEEA